MLHRLIKDLVRARREPAVEDGILDVAREMAAQSRHAEAIDVLSPLIDRRPDCVDALIARGAARSACGQAAESIADLTHAHALELEPDNVHVVYELAMTSYRIGDHKRALELCLRARKLDSAMGDARFPHAQLLLGGEYYFKLLERIHADRRRADAGDRHRSRTAARGAARVQSAPVCDNERRLFR